MPRKQKTITTTANLRQKSLLDMFSSSPRSSRHTATNSSKRRARHATSNVSTSDSDVAPIESKVKNKRKQRTFVKLGAKSDESDDSNVARIKFEERTSSVQSGDDVSGSDAGPSTQVRHAKRRRLLSSDSDENNESDSDAESRGLGLVQPRSSRTKQSLVIGSDSDEAQNTKPKRRLVKGVRSVSDEEEDDVMDGIKEDQIIENRLRGRSTKQSRFLKNLERLKKKKRGESASGSDESEQEASEEEDPEATIPGARPNWGEIEEDEDEDEDIEGFIVEDDGSTQAANLPAAFSMNTHQDLAHHFKIVCQYQVHLAVVDARKRKKVSKQLGDDEYFAVPLMITRRKLADLRDSIASSVWRPAYKKALQKLPEFDITMLDFAIPQCDACHLGGRMSKFVARLSGSPYDKDTFNALRVGTSDESNSDDEDLTRELHLGRWCAKRTEIFHELCHWEYKLFETLSREVTELSQKKRGTSRLIYSYEPPDDPTNGDEVMDWLDRRDIISTEWEVVKGLITRASNLDSDAKRGNADD